MPIELDSTEVIAYMVHKRADSNPCELTYKEIRAICEYVENIKSNVLTTFDLMSIDAFRVLYILDRNLLQSHTLPVVLQHPSIRS